MSELSFQTLKIAYPAAFTGNIFGAEVNMLTAITMANTPAIDGRENPSKNLKMRVRDASKRLYLRIASIDFSFPVHIKKIIN